MAESLEKTIEGIDKSFGKGSLMRLGDKQPNPIEAISTGSFGLDVALGIGGLPRGRIIEIFGPESSGKTTLATHVIAEAQKKKLLCAIIDAEHAFDAEYAQSLGVNVNDLYINQPDYGEQGLEITDRLIGSGKFGLIVVDSVAALVPKAELEGEMGDSKMGLHARLMSQALRKLTAKVSENNCTLIFINQLRDKIGVMFGSPEVTTGGNALKFYASVRLDVRRSTTIANSVMIGEEKIGNQTTVRVIKNKVAPPFKKAEFDILYGEGIDKAGEILDGAVLSNVVSKSGSWYSYKEANIGQGREAVRQLLKDNPDMLEEIKQEILSKKK
jgi:protein RecA